MSLVTGSQLQSSVQIIFKSMFFNIDNRNFLELVANFFTIVCIFLAGRNSIHTWWIGIIGSILFAVVFYNTQLYAVATLQVFFVVTCAIGWISWNINKSNKPITNVNFKMFGIMLGISIVISIGYAWLLHIFNITYTVIDSAILAFSVIAQLLMMARNIQTWKLWIIVNTLSVPLFWSRELYVTSILCGFFWVNAVYSYFYWNKLMKEAK